MPSTCLPCCWWLLVATTTELSSCDRNHIVQRAQNIYYLICYRKTVLTSGIESTSSAVPGRWVQCQGDCGELYCYRVAGGSASSALAWRKDFIKWVNSSCPNLLSIKESHYKYYSLSSAITENMYEENHR